MRRYKRTIEKLCMGMLILAVCIRFLTQTGLDVRAGQAISNTVQSPNFSSFMFYLELGRIGTWPEPEEEPADPVQPSIPSQDKPPVTPEPAEPEPQTPTQPEQPATDAPLQFSAAEAAAIAIGGACSYQVDKTALLQKPVSLDFNQEGPTVLIVHTHTSESFAQEAGWEYNETDTARTQDTDHSIVRVGKELADTLQSHGISVIHDTSFNDYPSYNGAYNRTLGKIESWLQQYPSIQMIIDVHRDAAVGADGVPVSRTATVNGEEAAKVMLVMGTDEGGLSHPNWKDNLSWGLKLQAMMNRDYPGLCRNLDLRTERFNQHATPGSMLVEVGYSGNTLKQALVSARDMGESLAQLIEGTN